MTSPGDQRHLDQVAASATMHAAIANQARHGGTRDGAVGVQLMRGLLVSVADDYLVVDIVDAEGNVIFEDLEVARPQEERRSFYDGQTFGGVTYDYVSATQRTATTGSGETEESANQFITPDYRVGGEIMVIGPVLGGTGVLNGSGQHVLYIVENHGNRGFGEVY